LHTELRVITVSELARIAGPTDTYGPYCIYYSSGGAIVFLALVDKKLGKALEPLVTHARAGHGMKTMHA